MSTTTEPTNDAEREAADLLAQLDAKRNAFEEMNERHHYEETAIAQELNELHQRMERLTCNA